MLPRLEGGFSFVLMDDAHLIGVRDPHGFWPLVLGRIDGGWVLASETPRSTSSARTRPRGRARRDGRHRRDGPCSSIRFAEPAPKLCLFEFVYFARPDAKLYGPACTRRASAWARASPARRPGQADMVMPVPESGVPAAQGFATRVGHPYGDGLVKNRYIGRTFISRARPAQRSACA